MFANALFAYLDPGTGAILLQAIAAGVLTLAVFFRRTLLAPLRMFTRRRKSSDSGE